MSAFSEKVKEAGDKALAAVTTGEAKEENLHRADLHRERANEITADNKERKYEARLSRQQKGMDMTQQKLDASRESNLQTNLPNPSHVDTRRINISSEGSNVDVITPQSTTTTTTTIHSTTTEPFGS